MHHTHQRARLALGIIGYKLNAASRWIQHHGPSLSPLRQGARKLLQKVGLVYQAPTIERTLVKQRAGERMTLDKFLNAAEAQFKQQLHDDGIVFTATHELWDQLENEYPDAAQGLYKKCKRETVALRNDPTLSGITSLFDAIRDKTGIPRDAETTSSESGS